jgi:hypothetical protein
MKTKAIMPASGVKRTMLRMWEWKKSIVCLGGLKR